MALSCRYVTSASENARRMATRSSGHMNKGANFKITSENFSYHWKGNLLWVTEMLGLLVRLEIPDDCKRID